MFLMSATRPAGVSEDARVTAGGGEGQADVTETDDRNAHGVVSER